MLGPFKRVLTTTAVTLWTSLTHPLERACARYSLEGWRRSGMTPSGLGSGVGEFIVDILYFIDDKRLKYRTA